MPNVLVIDLGTTYFKACLFDETGALLALQRCPAPVTRAEGPFREIEVDVFRACITQLVHGLGAKPGLLSSAAAMTFATQTNSFVLLDKADRPLTPIILWNDRRAEDLPGLEETLHHLAEHPARTGVPVMSPEFMVAKLAWLRMHQPDLLEKTAHLCLLSDYLTLWCTGEHLTEAGTAGLTGLLDIHEGQWREDALATLQMDSAWMPRAVRAGTEAGPLLLEVGTAFGLPAGCRFIVGCLDQYAGAIGAGNVAPGEVSETTGTVLATVRCTQEPTGAGPQNFVGPAFDPGLYYHMNFGDTSGALIEVFREALPDAPAFAALDAMAAEAAPGVSPSLPWRAASPVLRRCCEAWARERTRGEAVRAILEGVAYALHDQVAALCGGAWPGRITCVGGAARSPLWLQIKADVLNVPTVAIDCPEPTSLGAALLALRGLRAKELPALVRECVRYGVVYVPDASHHELYQKILSKEF